MHLIRSLIYMKYKAFHFKFLNTNLSWIICIYKKKKKITEAMTERKLLQTTAVNQSKRITHHTQHTYIVTLRNWRWLWGEVFHRESHKGQNLNWNHYVFHDILFTLTNLKPVFQVPLLLNVFWTVFCTLKLSKKPFLQGLKELEQGKFKENLLSIFSTNTLRLPILQHIEGILADSSHEFLILGKLLASFTAAATKQYFRIFTVAVPWQ